MIEGALTVWSGTWRGGLSALPQLGFCFYNWAQSGIKRDECLGFQRVLECDRFEDEEETDCHGDCPQGPWLQPDVEGVQPQVKNLGGLSKPAGRSVQYERTGRGKGGALMVTRIIK